MDERGVTGRFIAFEGIDGSGKTTTAAHLVGLLRRSGVPATLVAHNSTDVGQPAVSQYVAELVSLKQRTHSFDYASLGAVHWALIRASYYALVDRFVVGPALERGEVTVADGWYHKFIARVTAAGHADDPQAVRSIFAPVRSPDTVLLLDTAPEVAADRKKDINDAEYGPTRRGEGSRSVFARYQRQVRGELLRMADPRVWQVIPTDDLGPGRVAAACLDALRGQGLLAEGSRVR
ncbi:thymidylate kinase [Micromonospora sp. AKA38]|nr:thymidylate kinase [Micromonospora sp. AKA38]